MREDIGPIELLKTLGDGSVMEDFYQRLSELLMAVRMAHKKGKIVLTVQVSPTKDVDVQRVGIWGDVTAKIPHIERNAEFFYVNDHCELSKRNPRQPALSPNTVKMPSVDERDDLDGQSRAAGEKA